MKLCPSEAEAVGDAAHLAGAPHLLSPRGTAYETLPDQS